ncbi:ribonuclease D [Celeribacter marinus]|uniref:Ribonuclease D related protein n=1 Tax=Celeribacter marinus TaxID=1397108 RepID=A0A0P0ACE5_9RHOB|nr:ribonuclease D related protein [Celeribacter marinus]SFK91416.1 ribonuclease D [Celeribacter marinus]
MEPIVTNFLYKNDLPDDLSLGSVVAIDCETMGLNPHRDRLCLVQLCDGNGNAHLVQIAKGQSKAPNLCRLLEDPKTLKLFHYGRFDIAAMFHAFGALAAPVYCTKIASKLVRTYTDRHGLKNLIDQLLKVDISKYQQMSDWGAKDLKAAQLDYAASDVLHLHSLKEKLDAMLDREGRTEIAQNCFDFLPTRAKLDILGWQDTDIFSHQ